MADGVPVNIVAKRLGHARTSQTLDTYTHCLPNAQHVAAASIGRTLYGG
jgi:hypothetical protein